MISRDKILESAIDDVYNSAYYDRWGERVEGNVHAKALGNEVVVVDTDNHDKEVRRIACESQADAERVANIYNDVIANWCD